MSRFCIILAVFLVTVIFGMADMFIRCQQLQVYKDGGNWHCAFKDISDEDAKLIGIRPDVLASSWYGVLNYETDKEYTMEGKTVILCGADESFSTDIFKDLIVEGVYPKEKDQVMVAKSTKATLGIRIGDTISVNTPKEEQFTFEVTGFIKNVSKLMREDSIGIFLTTKGFRAIYPTIEDGGAANYNSVFYTQFSTKRNIQKAIDDIKQQFDLSDEQVFENVKLLGMLGQSKEPLMYQIYGSAVILFFLVLLAGILMIASSLNSNIAQRIQFFGMLRCIGATPKQVMRLVRREALNWCKTAIPTGISMGVVVIWSLCALLRFLSPGYFGEMPPFGISLPSIFAGICVGILTVLLAATSPAKKASMVSPLTAVTGNADKIKPIHKGADTRLYKVDTALGIHHAKAGKKNFILMVGSFSLSIILFLSFSAILDFMSHAINPLSPETPDLSIISRDNTCSISNEVMEQLMEKKAIKKVYGRKFAYEVPGIVNGEKAAVNVVTYEKNQLEWAKRNLLEGSVDEIEQKENTVLLVYDKNNLENMETSLQLELSGGMSELSIVGILATTPFSMNGEGYTAICSEQTFRQMFGETGYTIIDMKVNKAILEEEVNTIRNLVGDSAKFSDRRLSNQEAIGTYFSFALFSYGFLAFIALIAIFNIVNSIAMSVSSRMNQYGAMRAIGMSDGQLVKMVSVEAVCYAISGIFVGCIIGIPINRLLFQNLVTFQWGETWTVPLGTIGVIVALVVVSTVIAVRGPAKRIRHMSIVDTISAR